MSAVLDVDAVREWTVELLDQFLSQPTDADLDWRRFEIVDGVLVVGPPSVPYHHAPVASFAYQEKGPSPAGSTCSSVPGAFHGRGGASWNTLPPRSLHNVR